MRKYLAVFLLLVFLLNISGVFIAFKIQQFIFRNEVMRLIQQPGFEKDLTVITLTSVNRNFFEWEDDKEFRYEGTMYDVVKKKTSSEGASELYCIADEEETKLWNDLDELAKNNTADNAIKNIVKLLSNVFLPSQKITVDFFSGASLIQCCISFEIPLAESEILAPPPKSV